MYVTGVLAKARLYLWTVLIELNFKDADKLYLSKELRRNGKIEICFGRLVKAKFAGIAWKAKDKGIDGGEGVIVFLKLYKVMFTAVTGNRLDLL